MTLTDKIFERLRNGDLEDQIAEEFSDALNEARTRLKKEKETLAKVEKIKEDKLAAATDIMHSFNAYIGQFFPDIDEEEYFKDPQTIVDFFDALYDLAEVCKITIGNKDSGTRECECKNEPAATKEPTEPKISYTCDTYEKIGDEPAKRTHTEFKGEDALSMIKKSLAKLGI